jgi:acetylglutamate synthase
MIEHKYSDKGAQILELKPHYVELKSKLIIFTHCFQALHANFDSLCSTRNHLFNRAKVRVKNALIYIVCMGYCVS